MNASPEILPSLLQMLASLAVVLGGLLLAIRVRWGGHLFDRRSPVLLQRLVPVN